MWWNEGRSGEGVTLDRRADGTTFLAWFTHRPAAGTAGIDTTQVGTQYWVVADAAMAGRVLELNPVYSSTGTVFGPNLRFSDLSVKRWGSVRIEFTSCTTATFSWSSTGEDSAGFGSGSLQRDALLRERGHGALPRAGHRCRGQELGERPVVGRRCALGRGLVPRPPRRRTYVLRVVHAPPALRTRFSPSGRDSRAAGCDAKAAAILQRERGRALEPAALCDLRDGSFVAGEGVVRPIEPFGCERAPRA